MEILQKFGRNFACFSKNHPCFCAKICMVFWRYLQNFENFSTGTSKTFTPQSHPKHIPIVVPGDFDPAPAPCGANWVAVQVIPGYSQGWNQTLFKLKQKTSKSFNSWKILTLKTKSNLDEYTVFWTVRTSFLRKPWWHSPQPRLLMILCQKIVHDQLTEAELAGTRNTNGKGTFNASSKRKSIPMIYLDLKI